MLTFAMIKPLGGILKKLDVTEIISAMQDIDVEKADAKEKLGMKVLELVIPKIGDIADDLTHLCAVYKGVTMDEALQMDAIGTIKELFAEPGFADFFKRAAQSAPQK